jgi:2-haloacid dehalogenase/putative hydrolase of the HAD superfamily
MNKNEIDLITFDCYGTLIDWDGGIAEAFEREAARDNVTLDRESVIAAYHAEEPAVESEYKSYRDVLAETARRVAARLGWEIDKDRAGFLSASLPDWKPFADTNPALERLTTRFGLGILSNVDDGLLALTRRHFTVDFDLIVTAEQVRSYKPGYGHFLEAKARAGDQKIMHAAQSYFHDIVPARALDLTVVWVNRKSESVPEGGVRPTVEVSNLAQLADLMGV